MIPAVSGATAGAGTRLPYQWVMSGASGSLYTSTSTTAASWTSRTSSFGTSIIYAIASNGSDLYVAGGAAGKIASSPDGITWTQRTSPFGTDTVNGISYGGGLWVACANAGKIATSPDGITWTSRTSGVADALVSIDYDGTAFIIGRDSGGALRATNPTSTWTTINTTITYPTQVYYARGFNLWVAGQDPTSATGALASSTDGITWTSQNAPFALIANRPQCWVGNSTVFCTNSYTTTIPLVTYSLRSTTGSSYTNSTTPFTTVTQDAAADDSGLMAVVGAGNVWTSTDAITWTLRATPSSSSPAVCHSSNNG